MLKWLAFPLASLAAVTVVYNSWFLSLGIRTAGDWGFLLKATSDTLRRHYFSMWLSDNQFGRVLIDAGQALTYAAYGELSYYFNTSYALNERLIHLWPTVIIAILSSYFLVKYIFNDRSTAVLGALVYSANTYYLALLTGGLTLSAAYAFAPLVILFYLKAIDTQKVPPIIVCTLVFTICGAYEPRTAYIVAFLLVLIAFVHFFFIVLVRNRFTLRLLLKWTVIYGSPLILFILLNMYWLLGLAFAGGAGNTVIASSLFGNEFFDLPGALTLFHPFWTGGPVQPFFVHDIPLYFWLIPIAAIGGLILNRRNSKLLYFALIGIVGVLLSKQSGQPFPTLYYWLFTHVPGFNAFREASKFYLLMALSYAVLIPALYWYVKNHYHRRPLTIIAFVGVSLLFLPNLIPVATNNIGGTFKPRNIPRQYVQLNKFLNGPSDSRVLWVPQKSRWSFVSAAHPAVSASHLLDESWKDLKGGYRETDNATTTDEIESLLQQNYMATMLSSGGIKYVVIPMRDVQNADNFYRSYNDDPSMFAQALDHAEYLKEAAVHIEGFKIYQATAPIKPYFSSASELYPVNKSEQLPSVYKFWESSLKTKEDFNFILGDSSKPYTSDIRDLFEGYSAPSLRSGLVPLAETDSKKNNLYYFDKNYTNLSYTATSDSISFQTTNLPIPGDNKSLQKTTTATSHLNKAQDYLVSTGSNVESVARTSVPTNLGSPRDDTLLYSVDSANLVPAPPIQHSLWKRSVDSCILYKSAKTSIAMNSVKDDHLGQSVLSLSAKDHAACTGPPAIPVQPGEYLLHFKYRGFSAQFVSYRLSYNTRDNKTTTIDVPTSDNGWHVYESVIQVPSGATKLSLKLLARPSNQVKNSASTSYTEPKLVKLSKVATLKTASANLQKVTIATQALQNSKYPGYPYKNLIPNGSFEQGLWRKKVDDCNAYDSDAQLKMSLSTHTVSEGKAALQLEAKRHTACTSTAKFPVEGGATYLLQFDYQSPNAKKAGYVVTIDDKSATKISQLIPITDSSWHVYSKAITLPPGTHSLSLSVFAYSGDNNFNYFVNRYDNFVLQKVPDLQNRFYSVASPDVKLGRPRNIAFQAVSNTHKKVTVTGASKPFFLLMSEQYHPSWQLLMDNGVEKRINDYMPLVRQPRLPAKYHLKVNGFQNAWYIQPNEVCKNHPSTCTTNADGSYNMKLSVQFNAQRWFNFGLLISGTTAVACIGGLLFLTVKQRRSAQHGRKARPKYAFKKHL